MVAHERLVHAADLLHVERAVREPLPFEDQELLEDAEHRLVVDRRQLHGGASSGCVMGALPAGPQPSRKGTRAG